MPAAPATRGMFSESWESLSEEASDEDVLGEGCSATGDAILYIKSGAVRLKDDRNPTERL